MVVTTSEYLELVAVIFMITVVECLCPSNLVVVEEEETQKKISYIACVVPVDCSFITITIILNEFIGRFVCMILLCILSLRSMCIGIGQSALFACYLLFLREV